MSKPDKTAQSTPGAAVTQTAGKTFADHVSEGLAKEREKTARRGLTTDIQRLTRLDRILDSMDPDEALRTVEWLYGKYGPETSYEPVATQTPAPANGEG